MTEPAYYRLRDVEQIFAFSRDTLNRWVRAGLLVAHGQNHGRRVTGPSVRAALKRLEQGENLCQIVKEYEERAARAARPTAKAQSTGIENTAIGTISRQQTTDADSPAFEPLVSKPPDWLKRIT